MMVEDKDAPQGGDEHLRSVESLHDIEEEDEKEGDADDAQGGEISMVDGVAEGEITEGGVGECAGVEGENVEGEAAGVEGEEVDGEVEEAPVDGTCEAGGEEAETEERADVPCRESHSPLHQSEEQKKKAKVAAVRKQARQRDALKKHFARCSTPKANPVSKKPRGPPKETLSPVRSTTVRLEVNRGMKTRPRSMSLRLEDIKGQGRTVLSKRAKSQGDIEVIRIEPPEASVPSYSSVVFPMDGVSPSFSELFPACNRPPEPSSARPVKCPPTDREAIASRKTPREKKRSGGRYIPKFVPRRGDGENAWKSGICDCWSDPESYWSGVMEQVV